ncbi:MAG: dihydrofolate reductase [Atopobiaceae bacterium]|nr:dihydrofolate reductase [Atopobiaceae bacterium]
MRAIVAVCQDWGIGYRGGLLVQNPADMRSFVQHTKGATVIMGRATLESFPEQKPLPKRRNIVLSRQTNLEIEGVEQAHSVEELMELVQESSPDELWVIGGQTVYEQLLPYCNEVVVTKHDCIRPADTYFPNLDKQEDWEISSAVEGGVTDEGIAFSFVTYRRVGEGAEV